MFISLKVANFVNEEKTEKSETNNEKNMYQRYAFELLNEEEFERLTLAICKKVLGSGVHGFTKGPDGGRDGSFEGTAESYPSSASPWNGKMIIQAKHVDDSNKSCSDNDFFENKSGILKKEISRLNRMKVETGETFDCYLIFTNRKLSGGIHPKIQDLIKTDLNIKYADIIGFDDLTIFVNTYKELIKEFNLVRNYLPERFYESDIRKVILLFKNNKNWNKTNPVIDDKLDFVDKQKKNKLNKLSEDYFADISDHSLMYFDEINDFLKDPKNAELREYYNNTVSDLRGYILRNKKLFNFEEILETIINNIAGEEQDDIFRSRCLCRVFVHFMYWNCDIGRKH